MSSTHEMVGPLNAQFHADRRGFAQRWAISDRTANVAVGSACAHNTIATGAPQQKCYLMSGTSVHIHGTYVPVDEPSTASLAEVPTN